MGKNEYIGGLEELVLLSVQALADNAYGVTIHELLVDQTGRNISIGSLYITLLRLEDKGYLHSWKGEPTRERGGRIKKYYGLTGSGISVLTEAEHRRQILNRRVMGGVHG